MNKNIKTRIDELYEEYENDKRVINIDDWVLYDLFSEGYSYDDMCKHFSTEDIERVGYMEMVGGEPW
jgi:hypothetical protein